MCIRDRVDVGQDVVLGSKDAVAQRDFERLAFDGRHQGAVAGRVAVVGEVAAVDQHVGANLDGVTALEKTVDDLRPGVGRWAAVGDNAAAVVRAKPATDEALILRVAADGRALQVKGPVRRVVEAGVLDVDSVVRVAVDEMIVAAAVEVAIVDVQPLVAVFGRPESDTALQMCIRDRA